MKKFALILLLNALFIGSASGQFVTTGDATLQSCGKYKVTPDLPNMIGSFYEATPINLTSDFTKLFSVNFGCDNSGGSGLVFVMKTGPWVVGTGGAGMGYQGMAGNSLAVEFDTRDDNMALANWDIAADHIGLFKSGSINHDIANPNNLSGIATNIKPGFTNVEDCQTHLVEINWDYVNATSQTIIVKVDGITSMTKTGDFINVALAGNPLVVWGWTAATTSIPGVDNEQIVGIALEPSFTISPTNCPGQTINFTDASIAQNTIVGWNWDFDGLGSSILQNPSFSFATAGSYDVTLTVTDNLGCTNSATIEIGVGFEVDPTADNSPICPNTSTVLHANAAPFVGFNCCFKLVLKDTWGDGWGIPANTVTVYADGTAVGTYTPINAGGGVPGGTADTIDLCFNHGTVVDVVISGVNTPFECSYLMLDDGGATMVSVNAGASWTNGNTQSFTVNCGITPPAYTYVWDNGAYLSSTTSADPTATIPSSTWFHVNVTDPGTGCVILDSVQVLTHPPVTATISGNQTVCQGQSANLQINFTGTAPFTVNVTGPGGPLPPVTGIMTTLYNLSVNQNGNYTITAATGSGCVGTFSGTGTLNVIIPPVVDIAASAQYCDGDVIAPLNVVSTNGGTVNWYDNAGLVGPPLATGNSFTPTQGIGTVTYYAAETEGVLGCQGPSDNVVIIVHPIPAAPNWTGNTTYCEGDVPTPLTGIPTLGGTITWYNNMPPATILSTLLSFNPGLVVGTTVLYITETANGCESASTPISILVKPTPLAPTVTGDLLYCEGETPTPLTATPTIGGTINWENALGLNLGTGTTYTPGLTNGFTNIHVFETLNGCTGPDAIVTIEVQPAPMVTVTSQIAICIGDSVFVTALNNGYTITWSDGQTGADVWLGPDTTTNYVVTATNPLCGFAEDSIKIIVNYLPDVVAGNDTLIGIGGEVTLWAECPINVTYEWIPNIDQCLVSDCSEVYDVPDQTTLYVVIVTDPIGCTNSDSVLVDINGFMEVFVPNIFSPNGDGWNDLLEIKGPRLFNYYIQIYDRWGKVVFESTEQKEYWDGKLNGSELAPQTFVYMLSGESVLGDKITKEGNVTIIK